MDITISLDHFNCGFCELTKKYPVIYSARPIYYEKIGDKIFSTFRVTITGFKNDIKKYLKELRKKNLIQKIRVIGEETNSLEFFSDLIAPIKNNVLYILWKNGIALESDFKIYDGKEIFEIKTPDKMLKFLVKELEKEGTVKVIKKTNRPDLKDVLTEKERFALKLARQWSYYNEKRGITLDELAKKCGISRTAFRNNIRRAERKLFSKIIDDL